MISGCPVSDPADVLMYSERMSPCSSMSWAWSCAPGRKMAVRRNAKTRLRLGKVLIAYNMVRSRVAVNTVLIEPLICRVEQPDRPFRCSCLACPPCRARTTSRKKEECRRRERGAGRGPTLCAGVTICCNESVAAVLTGCPVLDRSPGIIYSATN